jgi:soluble lytic murein transglycosylase-like protein
MTRFPAIVFAFSLLALAPAQAQAPAAYDAMIARHAAANGVPEALVRRVIVRESRYNPRAIGLGGAMGMMQIKTATARAMGYTGSPAGLLDPDVNMTYAVKYLAGAYRAANGNHDLAVSYYARGYYYQAKRQGFSPYGPVVLQERKARRASVTPASEFMH